MKKATIEAVANCDCNKCIFTTEKYDDFTCDEIKVGLLLMGLPDCDEKDVHYQVIVKESNK